jgi:hypothetical protein
MFKNLFPQNRAVYEIKWNYIVQPDRSQIAIKYGELALHAGYLRLQAHTQNM